MFEYYILASGSKGNSTLLICNNKKILIDFGLSLKTIKSRLALAEHDFNEIDYFFLTHDHPDHNSSLKQIDKTKLYAPNIDYTIQNKIRAFETFVLDDIEITPLPISHDCKEGVGFFFKYKEETLTYLTDTGYVSNKIRNIIKDSTYFLIESNYNPQLLLASARPNSLKDRIMSDLGHLSNEDCASVLINTVNPELTKEIVLMHISLETNSPELAYETIRVHLINAKINITNILIKTASQYDVIFGINVNNNKQLVG